MFWHCIFDLRPSILLSIGVLNSKSFQVSFSESLQHDTASTGLRGRRRLSFSAYRKSSSLMNGGNLNTGEAGGTNSSSNSNVMYGGTMPKVFVK